MLMLDRLPFIGRSTPTVSSNYYNQIQSFMKKEELFFKELEKWRNIEISYTSKLSEFHHNLTSRPSQHNDTINCYLGVVMDCLLRNHKDLVNKINYDIFLRNYEEITKLLTQSKRLVDDEKKINMQLLEKKQELERVMSRKDKIKKNLYEEQTVNIFMTDAIEATMDKKLKSFNRMKELEKERDEYELKVKETKEIYYKLICHSKENQKKFREIYEKISKEKYEALIKFQLHLGNYSKSLTEGIQELTKNSSMNIQPTTITMQNSFTFQEEKYLERICEEYQGYLERSLEEISSNNLDQIICYSKNNDVKRKIKNIIESADIHPEETDEVTRQVQLVKKILGNRDCSLVENFKNIINKNSKYRLNFIFILQLFRLNNKFQIPNEELQSMIMLINELLVSCHEYKDAFVLKQVMVLLMTYYVIFRDEDKEEKVFILNFFKEAKLWRDIELWQSILIECIYIEKSATVRLFMVTSSNSNKNQLLETEKTAILNQFYYIVRNMVLFNFKQKQIREFSNKFIKLLKQDEKFTKDVNKSINDALKVDEECFQSKNIEEWIKIRSSKSI